MAPRRSPPISCCASKRVLFVSAVRVPMSGSVVSPPLHGLIPPVERPSSRSPRCVRWPPLGARPCFHSTSWDLSRLRWEAVLEALCVATSTHFAHMTRPSRRAFSTKRRRQEALPHWLSERSFRDRMHRVRHYGV